VTKIIKGKARNREQKMEMVDVDYSGEFLSQEMLFCMHLYILNSNIYWNF